ncbi:hypothetical protein Tsubulata_034671 [Turnera subulata]|uniref:asparagine--tRNA ligase n=1 Tax=Turnera subulata TaxID=218843 RepID=A0A9Q0J201_9ROSI|nr:hypothetical protein Tsubulata_034671 [Turnera subulata]
MAPSQESIVAPQEPKLDSQEHKLLASKKEPEMVSNEQEQHLPAAAALVSKYSNRVALKSILERGDGGAGLVGERLVIGGWVKSSMEVVKKEHVPSPQPQPQPQQQSQGDHKSQDVSCVEIFQTRIPLFRSLIKILGGGSSGGAGGGLYPARDKFEPMIPKQPPPSIAYLLVSDGSCVASLQVTVDSSVASTRQLLPIGTCILVEGVLKQTTGHGKHSVELNVEKILHLGTVDQDSYPLSKKRLPLENLRDFAHFRSRTTTVASVMRIRSALTMATHTFFQNNGFLSVQVPIITTADGEGFSDKFQVTTVFGKEGKEELTASVDTEGAGLDVVKAAIKEKSSLVEQLKRTESNREALAAALQDLRKTNQLASQIEAKEKVKSRATVKGDKVFPEEFFSQKTHLTVSGHLHLESFACALGNVYSFGPRFRANRKDSAKEVAEMWMVEAQMAFSQLEDAMNCAIDYFKFLCKWILQNCSEDMKFVLKRIDKTSIDRIQSMILYPYEKISYMDAVDILKRVTDRSFETKLEWGVALTAEHLSYLTDDVYKRPVIVYNHPKGTKPFYMRLNSDGKTVASFDMVVPKFGTIIRGSQSEERIDMLNTRIKELGLPRDQYEWYVDLRRNGTVVHSGFSLGFDLMVLFSTGLNDVKDAIPFPRSYGRVNN